VTYYATDDLSTHPPLSPWWPAYAVAYARARELGRRVVGVTTKAVAGVDPMRGVVVPNGIDPREWLAPAKAPSWFTALPGPRLLYVGTLDPRVEVETLAALAKAYPSGSVVLVGRCPDPDHYGQVRRLPNVTIAPPVDRAELTALVAAADVGLIPHVRDEQTEAMSPLKLYEYLAAGGPAVATDLEPVRRLQGPLVRVAPGGDFAAGVRAALESGPWGETERRRFIERNSWAKRCEQVLALALAE
jgi:glycosyltransferase involved in cell wall biosynthesis